MGTRVDSRPDLRALLRYDGEAYLLLAELDPGERTERVEGGCELCTFLVTDNLLNSNQAYL